MQLHKQSIMCEALGVSPYKLRNWIRWGLVWGTQAPKLGQKEWLFSTFKAVGIHIFNKLIEQGIDQYFASDCFRFWCRKESNIYPGGFFVMGGWMKDYGIVYGEFVDDTDELVKFINNHKLASIFVLKVPDLVTNVKDQLINIEQRGVYS